MLQLLRATQKMGRVILVRHGARTPIANQPWKQRVVHALGKWPGALRGELTELGHLQARHLGRSIGGELRPHTLLVAWSPEASGRCEHTARSIVQGVTDVHAPERVVALNECALGAAAATALLRGHMHSTKPPRLSLQGDVAAARHAIHRYFPGVLPAHAPDDKVARVLKFITTTYDTTALHGLLQPGAEAAVQGVRGNFGVRTVTPRKWAERSSEALAAFVDHAIQLPNCTTVLVGHDTTLTNFLVAQGRPAVAVPFCGHVVCGGVE
jgi:hypothetical protein